MSKPPLPPLHPWHTRWFLIAGHYITWPRQVREMKKLGFRRTGFMTWEPGPEDENG